MNNFDQSCFFFKKCSLTLLLEKHNLSLQAKVALETIKVKAQEIDKQYGISEKATAAKTAAVEKAKKLDEEFHITEKAATAANAVKTTVVATAQKVPPIILFKTCCDLSSCVLTDSTYLNEGTRESYLKVWC